MCHLICIKVWYHGKPYFQRHCYCIFLWKSCDFWGNNAIHPWLQVCIMIFLQKSHDSQEKKKQCKHGSTTLQSSVSRFKIRKYPHKCTKKLPRLPWYILWTPLTELFASIIEDCFKIQIHCTVKHCCSDSPDAHISLSGLESTQSVGKPQRVMRRESNVDVLT